jgi:ParB family chromosome partitioning protein
MVEDNPQINQSQQQSPQNNAPLILPLTDTEKYHNLAPQIKPQPIQAKPPREEKFSFHKDAIFHIETEKIKPNPFQPRKTFDEESLKELAASIREFGIIQPIVVVKIEHEVETGTQVEYQIIAGERRLMAAKMIGLERVPAIIKRIPPGAAQMEMAIVENIQRANLNSIETARAYAKLQDHFGLTQREIAAKLGKSRETIANAIRLLNLPTEIQDALAEGKINESQGRLLLTIDDLSQQMAVFGDLMANNLSVRELKNKIRRETKPAQSEENGQAAGTLTIDPELNAMQEQLIELLGAPVKIDPPAGGKNEKGKIIISFFSPEEIRGIIGKLNPKQ